MSGVCALTIVMPTGDCIYICGSEEILQAEVKAWSDFQIRMANERHEQEDDDLLKPENFLPRVLHGYSDTVARKPMTVAYRLIDVLIMTLAEK